MAALGLFIAGLALLIVGAELLTRGGTKIANLMGISPVVVGLTVVAIGTSMPELAIGVEAALAGSGELAIGNIAGTNTLNILLILGLIATIKPLPIELSTLRVDLPSMVFAAILFLAFALDGSLGRIEGIVLAVLAVAYTVIVIRASRKESVPAQLEFQREFGEALVPAEQRPAQRARGRRDFGMNLAALIGGIVIIVLGADWLVDGASDIARMIGASEAFIGLTIVAIGTSAPELVTAIVSTLRGDRRIAVGNLIGSSTYNILLILGVTMMVPGDPILISPNLSFIDIPLMLIAALVCIPIFVSGRKVVRTEGALMVTAYLLYLGYLITQRL